MYIFWAKLRHTGSKRPPNIASSVRKWMKNPFRVRNWQAHMQWYICARIGYPFEWIFIWVFRADWMAMEKDNDDDDDEAIKMKIDTKAPRHNMDEERTESKMHVMNKKMCSKLKFVVSAFASTSTLSLSLCISFKFKMTSLILIYIPLFGLLRSYFPYEILSNIEHINESLRMRCVFEFVPFDGFLFFLLFVRSPCIRNAVCDKTIMPPHIVVAALCAFWDRLQEPKRQFNTKSYANKKRTNVEEKERNGNAQCDADKTFSTIFRPEPRHNNHCPTVERTHER